MLELKIIFPNFQISILFWLIIFLIFSLKKKTKKEKKGGETNQEKKTKKKRRELKILAYLLSTWRPFLVKPKLPSPPPKTPHPPHLQASQAFPSNLNPIPESNSRFEILFQLLK